MTEFRSADGRTVFEGLDGSFSHNLSVCFAVDGKALCTDAEKLLGVPGLAKCFEVLAGRGVTPGKLKCLYRKIYKVARLVEDAQANERNAAADRLRRDDNARKDDSPF